MLTVNTFPNVGYLIADLPPELYDKLKAECDIACRSRYDNTIKKRKLVSGLSDTSDNKGVPTHYYLEETKEELSMFVALLAHEYNIRFPQYLQTFKILTHDVPYIPGTFWINVQEKHEYLPNHVHEGFLSFSAWIKVPYETSEQADGTGSSSKFAFTYTNSIGTICDFNMPVDKSFEGKIMMFPSKMPHCVYPFYSSDENRISISGNIMLDTSKYGGSRG